MAKFTKNDREYYFLECWQGSLKKSVGIFRKTDCFDEDLIFVFRIEKCAMNAAKIDKIQCRASHDEHRLKLIEIGNVCKIDDSAALCIHGELANAAQFALYKCLVGEHFHAIGKIASRAKRLLLLFILNR